MEQPVLSDSTAMVLAKSDSSEDLTSNGVDKLLSSTRPRDVLDGVTWCSLCVAKKNPKNRLEGRKDKWWFGIEQDVNGGLIKQIGLDVGSM